MKKHFAIYAVLLAVMATACRKDDFTPASGDAIRFGSPQISVGELGTFETRSSFQEDYLPDGATFGVMGYCVPYFQGSSTMQDWAAGAYGWGSIRTNAFPDVFYNQKVTCQGTTCIYDYENQSGAGPRRWYNAEDWPEAVNADAYQYTFFAWYPYDGFNNGGFTLDTPVSATAKGAPKLTFTMPFAEDSDPTTLLDDSRIPDAMLAVAYNRRKSDGAVTLNFSHILVGLGFAVTNYHESADIKVNSVTLHGSFVRSITVDFNRNSGETGFYAYEGRYNGIYTLSDTPFVLEPSGNVSLVGDKHLLLLSDVKGEFLGDVKVTVNYTYDGETRNFTTGRPGSFMPHAGTKYTAHLNFIGESFVINFEAENQWENGNEDDNEEIIIQ
ncbi:MAG: fimbrillin family protein [Alistipes sp.]|uniref:fimbrillin family protein n=1 Tax=Alistipes sp. TaxID=1872444 RepID=UPI0025BB9E86|nr:fimbrillin family protein [Alistipes sp.]MCD8275797.1 fimbrillin family protein [Alistipes sp.]